MRDSIRLGTVAGIPIGLHWSIALIAGLFTFSLATTILPASAAGFGTGAYLLTAAVTTAALLAAIVAHELGHSLVAKNNGINVSGISLFALGGVAKLEREPDNAGAAARIALAGPAVSLLLGVVGFFGAGIAGAFGLPALATAALTWFGLINVVMAVFNMIPALPLDGGRVLQAALWARSGDQHAATISAASIGRLLGWGLVAFGAWQFLAGATGGLWTALIGWFVITAARAEAGRARFEIARRSWAPPQWPGPWFAPQGATPPPPADAIDVDARKVV
ncbi:MAG: site-2 protease family protein [Actinomycetota bacterium]